MNTMSDVEIRLKGVEALVDALGEVQAERFVSLLLREPFDYTIWQRQLWTDVGLEELSRRAMASAEQDPAEPNKTLKPTT